LPLPVHAHPRKSCLIFHLVLDFFLAPTPFEHLAHLPPSPYPLHAWDASGCYLMRALAEIKRAQRASAPFCAPLSTFILPLILTDKPPLSERFQLRSERCPSQPCSGCGLFWCQTPRHPVPGPPTPSSAVRPSRRSAGGFSRDQQPSQPLPTAPGAFPRAAEPQGGSCFPPRPPSSSPRAGAFPGRVYWTLLPVPVSLSAHAEFDAFTEAQRGDVTSVVFTACLTFFSPLDISLLVFLQEKKPHKAKQSPKCKSHQRRGAVRFLLEPAHSRRGAEAAREGNRRGLSLPVCSQSSHRRSWESPPTRYSPANIEVRVLSSCSVKIPNRVGDFKDRGDKNPTLKAPG